MGTNTTPDRMRGLLVPASNITKNNLWAAQSDFTEMNPRAGVAKASQPFTGLVLEMAGEQSETITVETVQGGLPGAISAFKWEGEDSVELSQNANNIMTDWKYLNFYSSPSEVVDFDCIGTTDGSLYWVQEVKNVSLYTISVLKQKRDGTKTSLHTFVTTTLVSAPASPARPMIAQLKDGSLLVAYFAYTGTDQVNLVVWRSYDEGQNWKKISDRALAVPISVGPSFLDIEKTNLVVSDDFVSLSMSTFSNISNLFGNAHRQYVSRDQGASFRLVGSNGATYHMLSSVALPQGRLGFAYFSDTDTINFTRIANPGVNMGRTEYQGLKQVEVYSGGGKVFCSKTSAQLSGGSITTWYQDGVIYVAALDTSGVMYGFQSTDQGETWNFVSQTNSPAVDQGIMYDPSSAINLDRLKSTVWEGRTVILCQTNRSLGCMYFGGWSTINFPGLVPQPDRNQFLGWKDNWFHNQAPSISTNWTTSGTGSQTIISDGLRIITSANFRKYVYQNSIDHQKIYKFRMKVVSGASFVDDYIGFHVTSNYGIDVWTLRLRFRTTGFQVRDHSTALSSVSVDLTNFHEFMVFQDGETVLVYYREWDEKQAKKWTEVSVRLGTQGPGPTNVIEWGHLVNPTLSTESQWADFHISEDGTGLPGDIVRGGAYPTYGEYIYINEGLLLTAKEAPARAGDVYEIDARADYPIDNIFHQVALSPRVVWRSVDTARQNIAWYMDPVVGTTARTLGLSDVMGLHLTGINWKEASLDVWTGSTWTTVKNIDTSEGLQGTFRRHGATLVPNSTSRPFQVHFDEVRGWYAELDDHGTKYIVKIKQNTEGVWTTSLAKSPVLYIDTDHTDPATLPLNGDISIMPTSITLVSELFNRSATPGDFAFRLVIPAQDTLEGYFQVGTMVQGSMYFMAPQYQRGRTITHTPNIETVETMDGMFYTRKLSEGRRTFQVAWTEPVDTRTIMSLDPDYWQFSTSTGAQPVANYGDSPFSMLGMCRYLANQTPVVYLPSILKSTGAQDIQMFNRYHDHSLVRPEGDVSMESVLGEEGVDEMFRVASITLVEVE